MGSGLDLRPHQKRAVEQLGNGKILWGGVGSGKSRTIAHYYMEMEAPKDVYVITTAKKRDSLDWEKEFARLGVGKERDATVAGVLTVDSWNNIGRYRDVQGAYFIFDEQRLVGSGHWTSVFLRLASRNRWNILTATPGDTWLDYIPVFVANRFFKNRTEFKREHVQYSSYSKFPKVQRYLGVGKLIRLRHEILVEMPYESRAKRIPHHILVDYDEELFRRVLKDRWHVYENRPLRDSAELFLVMRKVVNSSPSRIQAMKQLLNQHSKLIVFYNFDYELFILRAMLSGVGKTNQKSATDMLSLWPNTSKETNLSSSTENVLTRSLKRSSDRSRKLLKPNKESCLKGKSTNDLFEQSLSDTKDSVTKQNELSKRWGPSSMSLDVAEWNGHRHDPIPNSDRWVYLVQYAAGAEGWNCIETNAMVFYSQTYSYKMWWQAHGRTDRMDTPFSELYYYYLKSNSVIDRAIAKSLSEKKNFNERSYIKAISTWGLSDVSN